MPVLDTPTPGLDAEGEIALDDDESVMCSGSEAGSYLRLIDSCITQLKAHGPSRTCNEKNDLRFYEVPGRLGWGIRRGLECVSERESV